MPVIFEKSRCGRSAYAMPSWQLEETDPIPAALCNDGVDLVEVGEVDIVRHYTALSRMNFGVDTGMYPLGSCTMKYNPKVNERVASLSGFTSLHPLSSPALAQGALEVLYDLSEYLATITGMRRFSFAPAAGAHGELAGLMVAKKYFEKKGEKRSVILIPDSAHGTNPASVAMCGFDVREVPSTPEGDVDMQRLSSMVDEDVAAMMLTSPNTLGLFDRNIVEIASVLHGKGALFYCDGANLNAILGVAKVRDMGFDLMHINLHKTFSTPHGGGGPGSGPLGVSDELEPFLPVPVVLKGDDGFYLEQNRPDSIGRIHSFHGNFLVALRAYAYIRMLGPDGIRDAGETAVLNANYLLSLLRREYNLPIDRICKHEFVLNDKDMPNGVTTNDIAKRILDYGFHAPTVYFPLLIPGAIMIEPTETENRETLESFAAAMIEIKREAESDPETVKSAPHSTPVRRVDAVLAARKPVLKWEG
ncbi:MAG TPA: aminomethyl-transferring glycine dehydrogenase subunit GcvPB [Spirochaetota bacterium]|nr:aminomethyl-transferring glycine dehydrogenase subunit GcvPB [Spirochaetota bacterium]